MRLREGIEKSSMSCFRIPPFLVVSCELKKEFLTMEVAF